MFDSSVRGVVAAMAMSGMREFTEGLGLVDRAPPEEVAEESAPGLMSRVPAGRRDEAIELAHWVYGAVGGAAYALLPVGLRAHRWAGPAYGLAMWTLYEAGVAPLLGLRGRERGRLVERLAIAADHVLYGAIVAGRPSGA